MPILSATYPVRAPKTAIRKAPRRSPRFKRRFRIASATIPTVTGRASSRIERSRDLQHHVGDHVRVGHRRPSGVVATDREARDAAVADRCVDARRPGGIRKRTAPGDGILLAATRGSLASELRRPEAGLREQGEERGLDVHVGGVAAHGHALPPEEPATRVQHHFLHPGNDRRGFLARDTPHGPGARDPGGSGSHVRATRGTRLARYQNSRGPGRSTLSRFQRSGDGSRSPISLR